MTTHSTLAELSPALCTFNLATTTGRFDFLWRLSECGEEGLLVATAHVWACLAPPEAYRATKMAQVAKVGGKGKKGLFNVLQKFIADFEIETDPPPLPERSNYDTSEEWHDAVGWHFERGEQAIMSVIERYSAILNGETPAVPATPAEVLIGPWPAAE